MVALIPGWRAEAALTLGYFISRFQREEEPSLTVGLLPPNTNAETSRRFHCPPLSLLA
jgi:hypothetical protein